MMDSPHRPHIILKRSLDFDHGIRRFDLNIIAKDRGVPPHQTNTSLSVFIDDVDDLPPVFTQEAYFTKVKEFFSITGKAIHKPLKIDPPVEAYDQDSLNSTLVYSIVSGNERNVFWMHPTAGTIYLKKEIDLEAENLLDNTFVLQVDVRQKNDVLKRALAKVEIEIVDINDNQPEFEVDLYNISIVENLPNGFSVLQVSWRIGKFLTSLHNRLLNRSTPSTATKAKTRCSSTKSSRKIRSVRSTSIRCPAG